MIFSFGPQADFPSFSGQCVHRSDKAALASPEWGTSDLGPFWDPFDNISQWLLHLCLILRFLTSSLSDFSRLLSSGNLLPALGPLSLANSNHTAQQNNPSSPFSRSMSRSSIASSSYPEDYPTPASDTTAVTTPAPSEGCLGSPSEHPQVLFGQDFLLPVEAKKRDHELSYVPGSALFSPTTFIFDFSLPQATALPPTSNAAPLSTVRRHSEPANLAACHFPSFFDPCHEVSPQIMSAPGDAMTRSIADNLASSSSASGSHSVPSSIAPHQTQLPCAVEIQHPRPVRAFKPQILLSGLHYDPKDFIRRRSEPIIPLPELDVAGHVPLDIVPEDGENGDSMEVEDSCVFEVSEESGDELTFDVFGDDGSWIGTESQDSLLNNEWSLLSSVPTGVQLPQQTDFPKPTARVPLNFGAAVSWKYTY